MMIFSKIKYIAVLLVMSCMVAGCAEEPSESSRDAELRLLNSTKSFYFKDATPFSGYADGSLWLISRSSAGTGSTPAVGNYVAFEYTGRMLPISGGYIFQTTDSMQAHLLGTFTYTAHFAPIYICDTTTIQPALFEALKDMRVGDTTTVMSASWLAFGASGSSTLNGAMSLPGNMPIIFTVVLKELVQDPKQRELDMVEDYVSNHPGFVPATDYDGNVLPGFYINYTDTVPLDSGHHYAETGDSVYVKYEGHYAQDNFLLDTNIDSVAKKYNWTITTTDSTYLGYVFSETAENAAVIPAFHYALLRVAPGSWVDAIFTSDYGYGKAGYTSPLAPTRPVYGYTPLRFKILLKKVN